MVVDPWREQQSRVLVELRGKQTQEDVARAAGLKFWRYSNLETGKVEMKTREIRKLAQAFGISAEDLSAKLGVTGAEIAATSPSPAPAYDPKAVLEASGVVPQDYIDKLVSDLYGRPEAEQRVLVDNAIRHYRELQQQAGAG